MVVGQLGDYIVEFLTLDSDKLLQIEENRIFIRVPTPQLQFLQVLGECLVILNEEGDFSLF